MNLLLVMAIALRPWRKSQPGPGTALARGALVLFLAWQTCGSLASNGPIETSQGLSTMVLIVVGAPGETEFGTNFATQATLWQKACALGQCSSMTIGLTDSTATNDYELLKQALESEPKTGFGDLWLVLIGHGAFDGKEAKFNLRGPDLSSADLALWLRPIQRRIAIIDTTSCSAPFLNKLSGTNRVIITATRSGSEQNFTRFGLYLAEAITDSKADLDKDGQVSLLEAFLMASRRVTDFYKIEGRLATEHALLDDNGDSRGTPADWFQGLRATKTPREGGAVDGLLAQQFRLVRNDVENKMSPEQIARRDSIERAILLHREKKSQLPEERYYRELESLLIEFARFYDSNSIDPTNAVK